MKCRHSYTLVLFAEIQSVAKPSSCIVYCAHRQCVCINHAYTSILITPNVAAPSKTQEMTFLSLFLHTINHP